MRARYEEAFQEFLRAIDEAVGSLSPEEYVDFLELAHGHIEGRLDAAKEELERT